MSTIRVGWRTSEQAARAKAAERERDDLKEKLSAERAKVARLYEQIAEIEQRYPDASAARKKIAARMSSPDDLEFDRVTAHIEAGTATYSEATRSFIAPRGWPEDVDPETFVAKQLGFARERFVVGVTDAPPTNGNGSTSNPFATSNGTTGTNGSRGKK